MTTIAESVSNLFKYKTVGSKHMTSKWDYRNPGFDFQLPELVKPGSLCGVLKIEEGVLQGERWKFAVTEDDDVLIETGSFGPIDAHFSALTGSLSFGWPRSCSLYKASITVDFQHEIPAPFTVGDWRLQPLPKEDLFSEEEIRRLSRTAAPVSVWDFNVALGDTVKEKYMSLTSHVNAVTRRMIDEGVRGNFWIIASPQVSSIFETSQDFEPNPDWHVGTAYCGVVQGAWHLIKSKSLDANTALIGCYPSQTMTVLRIANFVL
jgi:hypothetical protein